MAGDWLLVTLARFCPDYGLSRWRVRLPVPALALTVLRQSRNMGGQSLLESGEPS